MRNRRWNSLSGILFGLLFVCVGGGYLAEALGIVEDFTVFFDGWWTLFIIIPCFCGLLGKNGEKVGYLIGLAIGLFFLLSAQNVILADKLWAIFLAVLFVIIGVSMILPKKVKRDTDRNDGDRFDREDRVVDAAYTECDCSEGQDATGEENGRAFDEEAEGDLGPGERISSVAVFSGKDICINRTVFAGGTVTAVFGGIDLNLKNAIIREDVTIEAKAVFGGIDILVPPNVRVMVDSTAVLGGIDNGVAPQTSGKKVPTIYIKGTCVFGGVDVN